MRVKLLRISGGKCSKQHKQQVQRPCGQIPNRLEEKQEARAAGTE